MKLDDIIKVGYGVVSKIAKEYNVNRMTVSKALKGDRRVLKYDLIRAVAKNHPSSTILRRVETKQ